MIDSDPQKFTATDVPPREGVLTVDVVRDGLRFTVSHEGFGWRDVTISPATAIDLAVWLGHVLGTAWEEAKRGD